MHEKKLKKNFSLLEKVVFLQPQNKKRELFETLKKADVTQLVE